MTDVTQILNAIRQGDPSASDQPLTLEQFSVAGQNNLETHIPGGSNLG